MAVQKQKEGKTSKIRFYKFVNPQGGQTGKDFQNAGVVAGDYVVAVVYVDAVDGVLPLFVLMIADVGAVPAGAAATPASDGASGVVVWLGY